MAGGGGQGDQAGRSLCLPPSPSGTDWGRTSWSQQVNARGQSSCQSAMEGEGSSWSLHDVFVLDEVSLATFGKLLRHSSKGCVNCVNGVLKLASEQVSAGVYSSSLQPPPSPFPYFKRREKHHCTEL